QAARSARLALGLPDSRKVGLSVNAGNRPGHIHLAVGRARSARRRYIRPLSLRAQASSDHHDANPNKTMHDATLNYTAPFMHMIMVRLEVRPERVDDF